jgi:hypothetical protein
MTPEIWGLRQLRLPGHTISLELHLLDILYGHRGYNKQGRIDKKESNEASPNKCETQPHNHSQAILANLEVIRTSAN